MATFENSAFTVQITAKDSVTKSVSLGHSYGTWKTNNDGTHTKTCANDSSHKITENCRGGTATCTEKATCSDCGGKYGELKEHDYSTLKQSVTHHWYECACGAKSGEVEHTPSAAATETTDQVCTICGYVITPATGHIHSSHLTKTEAKSATCTQTGNIEYYVCSCGKWFTDSTATTEITDKDSVILAKTQHDYSTLKQSATHHWYECACGAKSGETAHTPSAAATETTDQVCTVCEYVITPATGHIHTNT